MAAIILEYPGIVGLQRWELCTKTQESAENLGLS